MSAGIDKKMVQEFYQRMTDRELISVLTQNLSGLTAEALDIVKDEIRKRNLDPHYSDVVDTQQQTFILPEKVYNAEACPVEEDTRIWLENSFQSLVAIFGSENTKNRKILTPERIHFPIRYDGSEHAAYETLKIVAKQMEVPAEKITLDFYDETLRKITEGSPGGIYWGKGNSDNFGISLVRTLLDEPENMVATMAHEIAHIKLLGENKIDENNEPLTDLATIFFGLGIFNANAAFETFTDSKYYGWKQAGYLTQMEWGYALSLFAYFRQEDQPGWADHLCKNVKADFLQGLNYIVANEQKVFLHQ